MQNKSITFGAQAFTSLERLYGEQKNTAKDLLEKVAKLGGQRWKERNDRSDPAADRPHQVYVIDGARGAGKTTLLLTLRRFLKHLGRDGQHGPLDNAQHGHCALRAELHAITGTQPPPGKASGFQPMACCLPVVFPENLEGEESVMESILARIDQVIEEKKATASNKAGHDLDELARELRDEVYAGWVFARRHGLDALLRDSLDYRDYAGHRADFSRIAAHRMHSWRAFLDRLLDALDVPLLAVFFDDTDLAPEHGWQIFDTVRTYLSHPRIVTFLALDFSLWQSRLERRAVETIVPFIETVNKLDPGWARQQIEQERKDSHAHLVKALPVSHRYSFGLRSRKDMNAVWKSGEEGSTGFFEYCAEKCVVAHRQASASSGIAWWLLACGGYAWLPFQSVRWALEFRNKCLNDEPPVHPLMGLWGNWEAISLGQLDDAACPSHTRLMARLLDMVAARKLSIDPHEAFLTVRGSETRSTDYETRLVAYVLDLHLAESRLDEAALANLSNLFPQTAWYPEFEALRSRAWLGVASRYHQGDGVPRNVLYLVDRQALHEIGMPPPGSSMRTFWFDDTWADTPFGLVTEQDELAGMLTELQREANLFLTLRSALNGLANESNRSAKYKSGEATGAVKRRGFVALMLLGVLVCPTREGEALLPLAEQIAGEKLRFPEKVGRLWNWRSFNAKVREQAIAAGYHRTLIYRALQVSHVPEGETGEYRSKNDSRYLLDMLQGRFQRLQQPSEPVFEGLALRSRTLLAWAVVESLPTLVRDSLEPPAGSQDSPEHSVQAWQQTLSAWENLVDLIEGSLPSVPLPAFADRVLQPFPDLEPGQMKRIHEECESGIKETRKVISSLSKSLKSPASRSKGKAGVGGPDALRLIQAARLAKISYGWIVDLADHLSRS